MMRTLFAAGLVAGLLTLSAHADDKPKPKKLDEAIDAKAMEAWMKHATPGPAHKLLDFGIGSWTYTGQAWMAPGAPPSSVTSPGPISTRASSPVPTGNNTGGLPLSTSYIHV